jgi:hypothetical protein
MGEWLYLPSMYTGNVRQRHHIRPLLLRIGRRGAERRLRVQAWLCWWWVPSKWIQFCNLHRVHGGTVLQPLKCHIMHAMPTGIKNRYWGERGSH